VGIQQSIDKRVVEKIYDLVKSGICNLSDVKRNLDYFVDKELFENKSLPSKDNRRFYPTPKDIRNHYNLAISSRRLAKMDQENVDCLVKKWRQNGDPDDKLHFRPYVAGDSNWAGSTKNANEPLFTSRQTLLFVLQMAWQRRLLLRYGQDICLLDATYKTSKYALPLFFICVKTNVSYQVVATFIVQNESEADISEALALLRVWNPSWKPKFFMTDKCEAEINAVEHNFEGNLIN